MLVVENHKSVRRLTLDRPKALNVLNLDLLRELEKEVAQAQSDPSVSVIFLDSSSDRAFCAGGDVKQVIVEKDNLEYAQSFFGLEYFLDYSLALSEKPIIGFANGYTMGGGLGLLQGCTYRVADQKTVFSMPEVLIGFFNDVGAGYFLNHCRYPEIGRYLGVSGARFSGADAFWLDLLDFTIPLGKKSDLLEKLAKEDYSDDPKEIKNKVGEILSEFQESVETIEIKSSAEKIVECANSATVVEFKERVESLVSQSTYFKEANQNLKEGSPLAATLVYRQLLQAQQLSRKEMFIADWEMAMQFCTRGEFSEGVRAKLIDKDNTPKWSYKRLVDVPDEIVADYLTESDFGNQTRLKIVNFEQ